MDKLHKLLRLVLQVSKPNLILLFFFSSVTKTVSITSTNNARISLFGVYNLNLYLTDKLAQ